MSEAAATWRDNVKTWKALVADSTTPTRTIGISASFTANALGPQLGLALYDEGLGVCQMLIGEYNQLHQSCLDPQAQFGEPVDVLVLLWRIEDLFPNAVQRIGRGDLAGIDELVADTDELVLLAGKAADSATVVFSLPPIIDVVGSDPLDQQSNRGLRAAHRAVCSAIETGLADHDNVELFDLDIPVAESGRSATRDLRRFLLYKQPYTEDFFPPLGRELARVLVNRTRSFPKCIAVDCDNTLWGGIIGEDGLDGIILGGDFPGSAHQVLQEQLLRLRQNGVLIAIVSKNEPEAVAEVFERHRGMVLEPSDIAAWRVNWQPKSENIRSLAAELNFGADEFVFLDDSSFEINEVRSALPEVTVLRVPEEPAEIPELLSRSSLFRGMKPNEDDQWRTARVQEERDRKAAGGAMSHEQFLDSLGLRVVVHEMAPEQLERTTQLINKTNQFNLTTIRRSADEVSRLATATSSKVLTCTVSDRFGEYGLVGVVILTGTDSETWEIDTYLLSCRVLGRGVEFGILAMAKQLAYKAGAAKLIGRYVSTPKNKQVSDLYPRAGFVSAPDGSFTWAPTDDYGAPPHIDLLGA